MNIYKHWIVDIRDINDMDYMMTIHKFSICIQTVYHGHSDGILLYFWDPDAPY